RAVNRLMKLDLLSYTENIFHDRQYSLNWQRIAELYEQYVSPERQPTRGQRAMPTRGQRAMHPKGAELEIPPSGRDSKKDSLDQSSANAPRETSRFTHNEHTKTSETKPNATPYSEKPPRVEREKTEPVSTAHSKESVSKDERPGKERKKSISVSSHLPAEAETLVTE